MQDFIQEHFITPIFARTGYNPINTVTYALIAILCLYAIWRFMRSKKYDFSSREFLFALSAFVLFGSTCRVVTDLSDAGAKLDPIFTYGYLTVTPGIYVVTAMLFLSALAVGRLLKSEWFAAACGLCLWLPCLFFLLPYAHNFSYAALSVVIAAAGSLLSFFLLGKFAGLKLAVHEKLAIAGQAFDGAATFVVIDIFSKATGAGYFEQHVLSAGIGEATPLGFGLFFAVKLALSTAIVYFVSKEGMGKSDKALVLLVVAIMGFAPGIRDVLRMLVGA